MDIEKSCFLVCDWFHTLEACLEISGVFIFNTGSCVRIVKFRPNS